MTSKPAAAAGTVCLFQPPYTELVPCSPDIVTQLVDVETWRGRAIVWQLLDHPRQQQEYERLRLKVPGLPLIVLLPPPSEIQRVLPMLPFVRFLAPRMILPHGLVDTPYRLRHVLAAPPRHVPSALTDYLVRRGLLRDRRAAREFQRIAELAPEIRSVGQLARRLYTSRRTIGRHLISHGLPVPSHCLHFARLLHVAVHLQSDDSAVFRIVTRYGYPDAFTMSNQMKRLVGHRPSEVRELLGWEWVVESWLKREGL